MLYHRSLVQGSGDSLPADICAQDLISREIYGDPNCRGELPTRLFVKIPQFPPRRSRYDSACWTGTLNISNQSGLSKVGGFTSQPPLAWYEYLYGGYFPTFRSIMSLFVIWFFCVIVMSQDITMNLVPAAEIKGDHNVKRLQRCNAKALCTSCVGRGLKRNEDGDILPRRQIALDIFVELVMYGVLAIPFNCFVGSLTVPGAPLFEEPVKFTVANISLVVSNATNMTNTTFVDPHVIGIWKPSLTGVGVVFDFVEMIPFLWVAVSSL